MIPLSNKEVESLIRDLTKLQKILTGELKRKVTNHLKTLIKTKSNGKT